MIRHYLVTALRVFERHRLYSFINVFGLAIGIACAIFIVLYANDEYSYDRWLPNSEDLYRLEVTAHIPGREPMVSAKAPFSVLSLVGQHIPQVKSVTHVVPEWMTIHTDGKEFHETVTVVDPNFLQVIQLPLVEGDARQALSQPASVVLSQSTATKYFGTTEAVGKTISVTLDRNDACDANDPACLSASYTMTVTGIVKDLPHNTQLVSDLLIPNTSRADELSPFEKQQSWNELSGYGYARLATGTNPATVLQELNPLLDRTFDLGKFGINVPASKVGEFRLTPFAKVHLASDKYGGMTPGGNENALIELLIISALIIFVACFNFMNLATARAMLRAREIGIRKLSGARRFDLLLQFLGEAIIMALAALVVALIIVEGLTPAFDRFLGVPIELHYLRDLAMVVGILLATVLVGIFSGSYPAFVLSAFRPVTALKPNESQNGGSGIFRSVLVVAQFAVSIGLGIATLVVLSQLNLARTLDFGFRRDGVVLVYGVQTMTPTTRDAFVSALRKNPRILGAAYSSEVPFDLHHTGGLRIHVPGQREYYQVLEINISPNFPQLYGMHLIAGRLLSDKRGEDLSTFDKIRNVLISEEAAKRLGFSAESAVGKSMDVIGEHNSTAHIVGVISDAKLQGTSELAQPIVYISDVSDAGALTRLSIRVAPDSASDTLSFIDTTWKSFEPEVVIGRRLLSAAFEDTLQTVQKQSVMVGVAAAIAICIGCLGLFGLTVFTAQRRTKEIGIRKIAGARTIDVVVLLLWRVSIPVIIGNILSWPIAYYFLRNWLNEYAYRVPLSLYYFVVVGVAALAIACLTVFVHTVRLARSNAVRALRYE